MADKRKEYNDWLKANPKATKEEKDTKIAELQAKDKEEKEAPLKGAQKNVAKASAATDAPLASKKDVSMASEDKAVKPVIEAEKKVNEAKMKDARNPESQIAVNNAENEMIEADKATDTAATENLEPEQNIETKIDNIAAEAGITIPEEAKNTQEVTFAMDALQNGDFVDLSKITLPTGEGLFQVNFDTNGNAYPPERAEIPKPALESRGAAAFFTVMSVLLSAFTGGLVPPINFGKLLGTEEYWDRVYEQNKNVADLMNKGAEQNLMNEVQNKQTQERIDIADANKDKLNAYAQLQEAEAGGTGYQQATLNADLAKALKDKDIDFNLDVLKLNQEQQVKMASLLYDQEVSKVFDQIKKMKSEGMSTDEIAKIVSSMAGTTSLARGLGYAKDAAGLVSGIIEAVKPTGNSDKKVKTFDAKPVNTNMLRKAWGKR